MPLFDQIVREETRPRRQNECAFEYLNTSARRGIISIREMLENWFEHLPQTAKADIRGRFRKRDEVQHQSAFFELFWHELLYSSGHTLRIHPAVPNTSTRPDFSIERDGIAQFYVEATLALPPSDPAVARRIAELHDTLDRINSPDFFLEFQYRGSPDSNIQGRPLRDRLERWLRQLNYDEISRYYENHDYEAIPTLTCTEEALTLTFTPIPKGPSHRGRHGARAVGINMPLDFRELSTDEDIRSAVEGKSSKYGQLNRPLIVVVNVMDDFCDDDDVWNALLGFIPSQNPNLRWQQQCARAPVGAWRARNGPRNAPVSAAVVTHQLSPSNIRTRVVRLIHNPWALIPLPVEFLGLEQRTIDLDNGQVRERAGTHPADLLGLPDPWPIPD
jgi:hypothetical protein